MASSLEESVLNKGCDYYDEDTPTCEPCSVKGKQLPADRFCSDCQEYLCRTCSTHHVSQKALRNHVLLNLDDVKKASRKPVKDICSHKCDSHNGKTIKYYCEEHSCLGCSACIFTQHKQCDEPIFIPTAAADVTNHGDFKSFDKNLKSLETACKAGIDDVAKMVQQIAVDESQIKTTFNDFRKRLNNALDRLEKEVTKTAKKIQQDETQNMKSMSKELEKSLSKVDTLTKKVSNLLSTGQRCDLFVMVKQEESQLVHLNEELDAITRDRSCQRFVFRPNNDVLKSANLGSLQTRTETVGRGSYTVPGLRQQPIKPVKKPPGQTKPTIRGRPSPAPPATNPQDAEYWRDMARRMKVGNRVRRGRDWDIAVHYYGLDEDGGGLGTVVREGGARGWWLVRWDRGGGEVEYWMGGDYGDVYVLEIVEER